MSMEKDICSLSGVTLVPRYSKLSSRSECNPASCGYFIPIVASPMDTVYSKELDECLTKMNVPVVVHRYFKSAVGQLNASLAPYNNPLRFFAVGKDQDWIKTLWDAGVRSFCVDMAHGDSKPCVDTVAFIKSLGSEATVMAGNVATKSGFLHLEEAGADMIRVGIGSGSVCTTRWATGFGVPIVYSLESAYEVREKALIIADGGIWHHGDIAKCMAYGADLCMAGRLLAATSLSSAEKFDKNGQVTTDQAEMAFAWYRGMASAEARKGVLKDASIEGTAGFVPYQGETEQLIKKLHKNLQASLSYGGVTNWKDFHKYVKKMKVDVSAWYETITHTVAV